MSETIVYSAKKIITMNPSRPEATHVAVRDGVFWERAASLNYRLGATSGSMSVSKTRC